MSDLRGDVCILFVTFHETAVAWGPEALVSVKQIL